MRRRNILALGALSTLLAVWWITHQTVSHGADETAKPGSSPQHPLFISIIQLIANPDAFDGKHVVVSGYVCIEHEGTCVYLHREDSEQALIKNGLWLQVNDVAATGTKEAEVNKHYAMVAGRFNAKNQGHLRLCSGSLEQITRMQPWPPARTP